MNIDSKIYVAGHSGMVGSAVVRRLKEIGYTSLILKSRNELDLFNQEAVRKFFDFEKPEYVIVSAARVGGIGANITFAADFLYENLEIQNNIIWQAHLHNVKKLLFLGSSCIYPRDCQQPMKEEYLLTGKPEPTNEGYSIAKIAGIKLCEKIYDQFNQVFISCMPTNIYGEGDNFDEKSSHVIPALILRMHEAKKNKNEKIVVWGSGKSKREFLCVDDLADSIIYIMNSYKERQFINIGSGTDVSIKELANLIKDIVGFDGELLFDASKPDGMPRKLLDVGKLHNLGWKHSIKLKEGIQKTYEWYLSSIS